MAKTAVSFGGLEDFVQSTGLLDDANVTFTNCHFGWTPPDYMKDKDPVAAFFSDLVQEDGTISNQMWTCGGAGLDKQQRPLLEPSEDGRYLQTESGFKLSTNSNFYKLVETFIKLGAPLKAGGADATMLEGIRAHLVRVDQKDKNGKPVLKPNGQPIQVLLPTELLGAEKGKKGVKAASAPGATATANNGASVDPEALHEAAVATLKDIIAEMSPDVKKSINAVKMRATQLLMASPYKTIRDPVVKQIQDPVWLDANASLFNATLTSDGFLVIPKA